MMSRIHIKQTLVTLIRIFIKCFAILSVLTVIWTGLVFALSGYGKTPLIFDFVTYLLFWNPELIMSEGRLLFGRMVLMMLFNSILWGLVYFAYKKINARGTKDDGDN